jgi:hypothetical protein
MGERRRVRHEYFDPIPPVPAALVEIVGELLEPQEDVLVAKLRGSVQTFDKYELRREVELALLLREPPTESAERARAVLLALAEPLIRHVGLNPHVVGAAAVPIFERHGVVVFERN